MPWVSRWKSLCSLSWGAKRGAARARGSFSSEVRPPLFAARVAFGATFDAHLTPSPRVRERVSLLPLLKRPDHCDLRSSPEVVKLLAKHGEPPVVLFSEEVLKINRRGEAVPRIMLVAANAVYLLDASTRRARRRMATRALSCVRMSEFADNFLALVCPAEYDVLLVCSRKIEAVMAMRDAKRAMSGAAISGDKAAAFDLPVEIGESFVYAAGADATKRVTFVRLENGEVNTTIRDDREAGTA